MSPSGYDVSPSSCQNPKGCSTTGKKCVFVIILEVDVYVIFVFYLKMQNIQSDPVVAVELVVLYIDLIPIPNNGNPDLVILKVVSECADEI